MLRHAMDLSGFHQVIFICCAPQAWELAGRILRVHKEQVCVETESDKGRPAPDSQGQQGQIEV